jgi:hypothetical protein
MFLFTFFSTSESFLLLLSIRELLNLSTVHSCLHRWITPALIARKLKWHLLSVEFPRPLDADVLHNNRIFCNLLTKYLYGIPIVSTLYYRTQIGNYAYHPLLCSPQSPSASTPIRMLHYGNVEDLSIGLSYLRRSRPPDTCNKKIPAWIVLVVTDRGGPLRFIYSENPQKLEWEKIWQLSLRQFGHCHPGDLYGDSRVARQRCTSVPIAVHLTEAFYPRYQVRFHALCLPTEERGPVCLPVFTSYVWIGNMSALYNPDSNCFITQATLHKMNKVAEFITDLADSSPVSSSPSSTVSKWMPISRYFV